MNDRTWQGASTGTGLLAQPMSPADRMAHDLASHVRVTPEVHRAVVRYGICRDTLAELDGQRITTTAQFNALASAQDGLAEAVATLTAAGRLHLVEDGGA